LVSPSTHTGQDVWFCRATNVVGHRYSRRGTLVTPSEVLRAYKSTNRGGHTASTLSLRCAPSHLWAEGDQITEATFGFPKKGHLARLQRGTAPFGHTNGRFVTRLCRSTQL